ncbi:hypothetical protein [Coprococcus sp. AF21-14LB]|uniref:hypothetical protein n=1 Tax=Coprococcus sp. AF21-14LB TaxID=2292231 RepID=UPI000E487AE4|nr:hypothetical protein [Coprococcus sp. AF21-14LB]RGS80029.1 hypothetical protein DWX73_06300 [Coprococcus sp. AF21-14LB]
MWKMKNLYKKAGAFFLATVLVASMASPISASAEGETEKEETAVQTVVQSEAEERVTEDKNETTSKDSYDVTNPVIERIVFDQKGETLNPGDTVRVVVEAYDADSGIQSIEARLGLLEPKTQSYEFHILNFVKKDDTNYYEATYELPKNTGYTEGRLESIKVTDNAGNESKDDNLNDMYSFSINGVESAPLKVIDFELNKNQETLKVNDEVLVSFSLTGDLEGIDLSLHSLDVVFEREDQQDVRTYRADYSETEKKFQALFRISSDMSGARWNFKEITHRWNGVIQSQDVTSIQNCWFEVEEYVEPEQPQEDTIKPQITSFEMSHNGEVVKPGDTVTFTVKATDNNAIDPNKAYVYMRAAVTDITESGKYVYLTYDEEKDAYVANSRSQKKHIRVNGIANFL